jgi:UDP-N-acetylglucosamine 2-epimerase (non-hydrolysing)
MVQGDTASAYAGAMAARPFHIPIVHVEAGIRSGDLDDPYPEESFRVEIDTLASQNRGWKFAPTDHAKCNLLDWWHTETTGNSGIDALYSHTQPTKEVVDRVVITLHRRESFGAPLERIVDGLERAAIQHPRIEFVWPTHPNPAVQAVIPRALHISIWPPQYDWAFGLLLSRSRAVITDSGGVQEESAALGIPCIVAREKTDRPESVELGLAKVVGRTEQGILDGLDWALGFSTRPDPSHCFGDGHAAPRIVDHLLENA